jgi:hypothetical protein
MMKYTKRQQIESNNFQQMWLVHKLLESPVRRVELMTGETIEATSSAQGWINTFHPRAEAPSSGTLLAQSAITGAVYLTKFELDEENGRQVYFTSMRCFGPAAIAQVEYGAMSPCLWRFWEGQPDDLERDRGAG